MSATNATTNYSLPIFLGTDKPAWLVDWNGAMNAIDAAIAQNASDIASEGTSISGLSTTVAAHTSSISTMSTQISTITTQTNLNTGNINTINSLIGNGTPTTTDQTIIGAINELHQDILDLDAKTYTVLATSTTGAASAQLESLFATYDALTSDQKKKTFLIDNRIGSVLHFQTGETYSNIHIDLPNNRVLVSTCIIAASDGKVYSSNIGTGGTTLNDYSSTVVTDGSFSLCI